MSEKTILFSLKRVRENHDESRHNVAVYARA